MKLSNSLLVIAVKSIEKTFIALCFVTAGSLFWSMLGLVSSAQAQTFEPEAVSIIISQSSKPVTYMTVIDKNTIVIQITEGEFIFHGYLERKSGNSFIGEDEQVRVMYDQGTKQVVVINNKTGTEFYNYYFSNTNEGAL
ncbi:MULTISPECIES: hypothetical protein [unclassified Nostoc]|uniref:hypothetical protein n=1 Tax=unclassified Nostoc TaxID=2593658 RepID=UPI0025AB18D8|nr:MULTISPECIES: hypothetical protein [unclassified Nostoc]MDM9584831.1 hypothetical protein [Nostoc sp. GT001]MDZ7948493.1 hypothetical protein [Nostoc sp. EfeVER01]MDZ7991807.1 hypothetical protein [Nostoc sp. EspVER01]